LEGLGDLRATVALDGSGVATSRGVVVEGTDGSVDKDAGSDVGMDVIVGGSSGMVDGSGTGVGSGRWSLVRRL
jgi:hypothetical protein